MNHRVTSLRAEPHAVRVEPAVGRRHPWRAITGRVFHTGAAGGHRPTRFMGRAVHLLGRRADGFTLIELLVVISIIGILAALMLAVTSQASFKMKLSRVKAELSQYETAIESYKAKFGSYPPDHLVALSGNQKMVNPTVNQLFYELTGTTNTAGGFMSPLDQQTLPSTALISTFGTAGFVNTSVADQSAKDFLPSLHLSQTGIIPGNPPVRILTVSVPWPLKSPGVPSPIPAAPQLNPVRYVSSSPTNSTTFDLWAEVPIGKRVYVLGNWNGYVPH